jgi:tetratricopeptide (TPR) repeat protein
MLHPHRVAVVALLALLVALGAGSASAHGPVHEQIRELSAAIDRAPRDAELYLRRGRAYLAAAHPDEAAQDLQRALALAPQLRAAHYFLGQAELAAGRAAAARESAERFLAALRDERDPDEARGGRFRGLVLLAQALSASEQHAAAADAYGRALSLGGARPDDYLAHAQELERDRRPADALAALEAGLRRLGSVITLERRALALELGLGRKEAALSRLDRLIAASPQPAEWCYQRGELLESLGRKQAAEESYRAGLAALARLPPGRLKTPALRELRKRLQAAHAR